AARSVVSARSRRPRRTTSTLLFARKRNRNVLTRRNSSAGSVILDLVFDFIPQEYPRRSARRPGCSGRPATRRPGSCERRLFRHAAVQARRARHAGGAVSGVALAHQVAERQTLLPALDDALAEFARIGVLEAARSAHDGGHGRARRLRTGDGRLDAVLDPPEERG